MKFNLIFFIKAILLPIIVSSETCAQNHSFVNVMDYISDTKTDVAAEIQKAIDDNPNRVIYFPDGIYKISSPILTPANPHKSVSLELANYAIIQPYGDWSYDKAMICLGGKEPYNTILIPGSNYYLSGGIIDCKGIAQGISVDSGRETVIKNTAIKNAQIGIHIKKGSNGGSSDTDVYSVNITGNMDKNSIGILIEGHDNTLSNIRIYRTQIGIMICSGANILRNIHPLYGSSDDSIYETGYGFVDKKGNNWYDFCYSDQYATGFLIESGSSIYHNCFAYWYSARGKKHTAFQSHGSFNSIVTNFTMGLNNRNFVSDNIILEEINSSRNGSGCFQNLRIDNPKLLTSNNHEKYIIK